MQELIPNNVKTSKLKFFNTAKLAVWPNWQCTKVCIIIYKGAGLALVP